MKINKVHIVLTALLLSLSCSSFTEAAAAGSSKKRGRDGAVAATRRAADRTNMSKNLVTQLRKRACGQRTQHLMGTMSKLQSSSLQRHVAALNKANEKTDTAERTAAINELLETPTPADSIALREDVREATREFPIRLFFKDNEIEAQTPEQCAAIDALLRICPTISKYVQTISMKRYGLPLFLEQNRERKYDALEEVDLYSADATQEQIALIIRFYPLLQKLNLSYNSPEAVDGIAALPAGKRLALTTLDLSYTKPTAAQVLAILERCPHLESLNLKDSLGSAAAIAALPADARLALKILDLATTNTTAAQVKAILERCPHLESLNLMGSLGAAAAIAALPAGTRLALKTLDLATTNTTATQVKAILERCPHLESLNLIDCAAAAAGIAALPAGTRLALKILDLALTTTTAAQIQAILERCPHLESLHLSYCVGAAAGIATLPVTTKLALKTLDLASTNTTAAQIQAILERCPHLKELRLHNCRGAAAGIIALPAGTKFALKILYLISTGITEEQVATIRRMAPGCMMVY